MAARARRATVRRRSAFHGGVEPPEGGLRKSSFLKPEDVRSISTDRLGRRLGSVSGQTMEAVETGHRVLLGL